MTRADFGNFSDHLSYLRQLAACAFLAVDSSIEAREAYNESIGIVLGLVIDGLENARAEIDDHMRDMPT